MLLERGRDELLDQPPVRPGPALVRGQPELDHLILWPSPAEPVGRHTGDAAVRRQAGERWRQQPGRVALEEQRHRYSRLTPTQRGPDRREERIEMILSAVELSAVELVAGELAVEHPDGLPVGRVSRRIGKPEEHAQVGGRGQGRPDVLLARRLEARRGDVVWNR
jgi:hypothetical protein